MAGTEDWRRNADTHKMDPGEMRAAGVEQSQRPPGRHPGEVLHQRSKLPLSMTTITIGGLLISATIGSMVLHTKKKPEATSVDVAKVAAGVADPKDITPESRNLFL